VKKRHQKRHEEAEKRQAEYDKLTPKQKIAKLDKKLGKNRGEKKERAKIQKLVDAQKAAFGTNEEINKQ
jgi:hypothetical protein